MLPLPNRIYKNLFLKYINFMKTLIIGGSSKIGRNFNSKKKNYLLTFNSNRIKNGVKFNLIKSNPCLNEYPMLNKKGRAYWKLHDLQFN